MTQNEMVDRALKEFDKKEARQQPFVMSSSVKAKIRREITLQRLQQVAQLPGMEEYEAIDRDRLPKPHHQFQAFINQSASEESSATKDILVDWNVPIKIRVILLPDVLT